MVGCIWSFGDVELGCIKLFKFVIWVGILFD